MLQKRAKRPIAEDLHIAVLALGLCWSLPLPRLVTSHSQFAEAFESFVAAFKLEELPSCLRLRVTEDLIQEAALCARRALLAEVRSQPLVALGVSLSSARPRVPWPLMMRDLPRLCCSIIIGSISGSSLIAAGFFWPPYAAFAEEYERARRVRANIYWDVGAPSSPAAPPSRRALAALGRRRRFWSPLCEARGPLRCVVGGHPLRGFPWQGFALFRRIWAPVFESDRAPDLAAAARLLTFVTPCPFPFEAPSSATICGFLRRARFSAPGPDGIHHHASLRAGPSAIFSLHLMACEFASGVLPPLGGGGSTRSFRFVLLREPTPRTPLQQEGVVRATADTRPIGLSTCDAKAACGASYSSGRRVMKDFVSPQQRGFVPGRSVLDNIVQLSTQGCFFLIAPFCRPSLLLRQWFCSRHGLSSAWLA